MSKSGSVAQDINMNKLNMQSPITIIERSASVNKIETVGNMHDVHAKFNEQELNQKKMNLKIGLLETQLDDMNDSCQILEQENKALKETNEFLKKMNLENKSKR